MKKGETKILEKFANIEVSLLAKMFFFVVAVVVVVFLIQRNYNASATVR